MSPSTGAIDAFVFPPFPSSDISSLKEEFPLYIAAAEDVDYDPLQFWKQHENDLHAWSQAARQILLLPLQNEFLLYFEIHSVSVSTHLFKTTSRLP